MDKSVLMNTNIHEGTKLGDVGDYARQHHANREVIYALYAGGKLKLLYLLARVATRFLQFLHDVCEGGHSHCISDIALEVDALA